jgi:hypothetical protein
VLVKNDQGERFDNRTSNVRFQRKVCGSKECKFKTGIVTVKVEESKQNDDDDEW